jgi:hypothetical protein
MSVNRACAPEEGRVTLFRKTLQAGKAWNIIPHPALPLFHLEDAFRSHHTSSARPFVADAVAYACAFVAIAVFGVVFLNFSFINLNLYRGSTAGY